MDGGGFSDPNWCDAHGGVHNIRAEHCAIGEHCTSVLVECNAAHNVDDHGRKCCNCGVDAIPQGRD